MQFLRYFFLPLTLLFFSCAQKAPTAFVESHYKIPNFPSGSGMELLDGKIFACGDDAAFIWIMDQEGKKIDDWRVWDTSQLQNNRIPKPIKPDFEAISLFPIDGDTALLIFGSGSKSPQRDVLLEAHLTESKHGYKKDVSNLYQWMRNKAGINEDHFNIEGASYWKNNLILLNRESNQMYVFDANTFEQFLSTNDTALLKMEFFDFELPKMDDFEATFSGCSLIPGTDKLLFSASVEYNDDSYHDGEIGGSYVGIINLSEEKPVIEWVENLKDQEGNTFKVKLEALIFQSYFKNGMKISGITDDDDGTTSFLNIVLESI